MVKDGGRCQLWWTKRIFEVKQGWQRSSEFFRVLVSTRIHELCDRRTLPCGKAEGVKHSINSLFEGKNIREIAASGSKRLIEVSLKAKYNTLTRNILDYSPNSRMSPRVVEHKY
jgi:hypothetical protein